MKPEKFIEKYYPYAKEIEKETTIPAIVILAQAALESGWGKKSIGNNVFGIKYKKGDLLHKRVLTTEYDQRKDAYDEKDIVSIEYIPKINKYKFKVYQSFADYPSPKEAFLAHYRLLLTDRYKDALNYRSFPVRYLTALWEAGYATDVGYDEKIEKMVFSVQKRLPKEVKETVEVMEKMVSKPTPKLANDPPEKERKLKGL